MLKEVNDAAAFTCETVEQVAAALEYTVAGKETERKAEGFELRSRLEKKR